MTRRRGQKFVPTKSQIQDILKQYSSGIGSTKIAEKYQVCISVIRRILKENGIVMKRIFDADKPEIQNKIFEMYLDGFTHEEIRKECKVRHIGKILKQKYPGYENKKKKFLRKDIVDSFGYIKIRLDKDDPYFEMTRGNGYIFKHRYIMAQHLKRLLTTDEQVHHIDGDRSNNDISNLQLRTTYHGPGQKFQCCNCGSHNIKPVEI